MEKMTQDKIESFHSEAYKIADDIVKNLEKNFPYNVSIYAIIIALCKIHSYSDVPFEETLEILARDGVELVKRYKKE